MTLAERVGRLLGSQPVSWERRAAPWQPTEDVPGANERFAVLLEDGRRVFVKAAQSEYLAASLRREHEVYAHLRGPFIPALVAFEDDPLYPVLVLEDLSDADWSVRWDEKRVAAVRAALRELAACEPSPGTRTVRETFPHFFDRWRVLEADPEPFLSTGIRSREWLERALPVLREAAADAPVDGDDLLHLDVRSDNICFRDGSALLVDWNWSAIGNGDFDVAAWLPSLALESGPQPWEVLPQAGGLASFIAGFWAAVVGLPPPETAPLVRALQRSQLEVTLVWAERELGVS